MTTIDYIDVNGDISQEVEMFSIGLTANDRNQPNHGFRPFGDDVNIEDKDMFPFEEVKTKEKEMIDRLEHKNCKVLSVKSELLSKRRYKRRLAKENKRRTKYS
jgi:hypothetical protein